MALLSWTASAKRSDGVDISGTLDGLSVEDGDLSSPAPDEQAFTGHISGGTITLELAGTKVAGTISADSLVLHSVATEASGDPSEPASPDDAVTFKPATKAQFEAAAAQLRSQAPAVGAASQLKNDLRKVAVAMETVAVDTVTYPTHVTRDASGVIDLGDSVTVTVSPGDTVTIAVNADATKYCLVGSNAASGQRFVSMSDSTMPVATTAGCPAGYRDVG